MSVQWEGLTRVPYDWLGLDGYAWWHGRLPGEVAAERSARKEAIRLARTDPFITRRDVVAMWIGVRNAAVVAVPAWLVIVYWLLR